MKVTFHKKNSEGNVNLINSLIKTDFSLRLIKIYVIYNV